MNSQQVANFQRAVWAHYRSQGRHDLPWRKTRDAYRILVSEMMLQQTQVSRVLEYYPRFIKRFPNFRALERAEAANVLRAWQGLGYNRRALYLKRTAEIVVRQYHGKLPSDPEALENLPGIGTGTAGAIAAFAFNRPAVFVETNIRRAFIHYFFPCRKKVNDRQIFRLAEAVLPRRRAREWCFALMDYGAMLGENLPKRANPNRRSAHYATQAKFAGSNRELRGKILRIMLSNKPRKFESDAALAQRTGSSLARTRAVLRALRREELLNS